MKALLTFLFLSTLAFAGVEVTDTGRVLKDGADIGDVASSMKNNVATPLEIQTALVAVLDKLKAAKTTTEADAAKKLAAAESAKAALESGDASAKTAALAAIEDARQPEKDKKKAALDDQITKLQAERAALDEAALKIGK